MALASLAPGLDRLRHYERAWARPDVMAGVTVAAYLVPQCMAYGQLAGLDPVVGLWAVLAPLALYALLGSSRQLSVGPESTTAVMTATAIAPLAAGDPARYATLAAALALVVGGVCLLARLLRAGVIANLLSRPILVGYMAGVALIMISGQLTRVTGVPTEGDTFLEEVRSFVGGLDAFDMPTALLAAAVLAFLLVGSWRFPRAPVPLLAVLGSTVVVAVLDLSQDGILVVGAIPTGLPGPGLPDVSTTDLVALVGPALGVALVGFSDNVLTARSFAARAGHRVDAEQELLALGVANVGTGLTQGFPVSSSGSRTALGASLGSRSQAYSLVALVCVVAVLVFLGPVLEQFPTAALGAIVVYAALKLIDRPELRRLRRFRRSEFLLAMAALVGVLVTGILVGVLVAVGFSILELLTRLMHPHDSVIARVPGVPGLHDVDDYPQAQRIPGLVVYRYDAPLIFANADDFESRALASVDREERLHHVEWFVVNMEANVEVDLTGLDALEELRRTLTGRGIVFGLARVKQDLLAQLDRAGITDRIGADHIWPTLPTMIDAFEHRPGAPVDDD